MRLKARDAKLGSSRLILLHQSAISISPARSRESALYLGVSASRDSLSASLRKVKVAKAAGRSDSGKRSLKRSGLTMRADLKKETETGLNATFAMRDKRVLSTSVVRMSRS